jgi:hypothetical protein
VRKSRLLCRSGCERSERTRSDTESAFGQKRFFKPLFVDVWTDAITSFARAYASTGTLLEDRALDVGARERDDDEDEQQRFGDTPRLFFTHFFCFLFVRSLYLGKSADVSAAVHDDANTARADTDDARSARSSERVRAYTFECLNLLVFPLVLLTDVCALLLWWLLALPAVPVFLLLFVLTGGCCHTRWSTRRLRHYYCWTLAVIVYLVSLAAAIAVGVYSWSMLGAFAAFVVTYMFARVIISSNKL